MVKHYIQIVAIIPNFSVIGNAAKVLLLVTLSNWELIVRDIETFEGHRGGSHSMFELLESLLKSTLQAS